MKLLIVLSSVLLGKKYIEQINVYIEKKYEKVSKISRTRMIRISFEDLFEMYVFVFIKDTIF
jgi:hypothetical protein